MDNSIQVKNFIQNEWRDYADYDNRRSLPHIMDGLKITQRKVMYSAIRLPKGVLMKVSQFSNKVADETVYHHGEASMMDTVVMMAQDYPGSNCYPLLEKEGQFGTRLSNKPSAARYIKCKLHDNWNTFFKKEDQDVVESLYEEGTEIEPVCYIPIIPMILVNGAYGIGNGFSSYIQRYSVSDIVKACQEMTKHGKVKTPMVPSILGWTGDITKVDRQVTFTGKLNIVNTRKIEIVELPPGVFDNDSYKVHLNKLIESKTIKSFSNGSTEDRWLWTIHCAKELTEKPMDELLKTFKLVYKISETITGWGMDARAPMAFDGPESLIEYWYHERIKLYQKSIDHQIEECEKTIIRADLRSKFVKWCLNNDFRKLSKKEFIANTVAGVKGLDEETAGEFVSMPMYRITTDEVEKLANEVKAMLESLRELHALTPVGEMARNLKELKLK